MGKRKKSGKKVTVQKRVYKIPKFFECPYCGIKDGIKISISQKERKAELKCRSCGVEDKDIEVTTLTEPIDVYDDWMDRARETNKEYNPDTIEDNDESDKNDYSDGYERNLTKKGSSESDSSDSNLSDSD